MDRARRPVDRAAAADDLADDLGPTFGSSSDAARLEQLALELDSGWRGSRRIRRAAAPSREQDFIGSTAYRVNQLADDLREQRLSAEFEQAQAAASRAVQVAPHTIRSVPGRTPSFQGDLPLAYESHQYSDEPQFGQQAQVISESFEQEQVLAAMEARHAVLAQRLRAREALLRNEAAQHADLERSLQAGRQEINMQKAQQAELQEQLQRKAELQKAEETEQESRSASLRQRQQRLKLSTDVLSRRERDQTSSGPSSAKLEEQLSGDSLAEDLEDVVELLANVQGLLPIEKREARFNQLSAMQRLTDGGDERKLTAYFLPMVWLAWLHFLALSQRDKEKKLGRSGRLEAAKVATRKQRIHLQSDARRASQKILSPESAEKAKMQKVKGAKTALKLRKLPLNTRSSLKGEQESDDEVIGREVWRQRGDEKEQEESADSEHEGFSANTLLSALRWFSWQQHLVYARRVAEQLAKAHEVTSPSLSTRFALAWFELARTMSFKHRAAIQFATLSLKADREVPPNGIARTFLVTAAWALRWFELNRQRYDASRFAAHGARAIEAASASAFASVALQWFEWQRWLVNRRSEAAAEKDRRLVAFRKSSMALASKWFAGWQRYFTVRKTAAALAQMPSVAGIRLRLHFVLQSWSQSVRRSGRRARWQSLFISTTELPDLYMLLRTWHAWSAETAHQRAMNVVEEAISLRNDALELCSRVAKQREALAPPWSLLAVWWFWIRSCRLPLAGKKLSKSSELQFTATWRQVLLWCVQAAWQAWCSSLWASRNSKLSRVSDLASQRSLFVVQRATKYLEQFDVVASTQNAFTAWLRFVTLSKTELLDSELATAKDRFKLVSEEHTAALDAAELNHQLALERERTGLKEVENYHKLAAANRSLAAEAIDERTALALEKATLELEEKHQVEIAKERQQHGLALSQQEAEAEAADLQLRLEIESLQADLAASEDRAENRAIAVSKQHRAALESLEHGHQLSVATSEQKIQHALDRHRWDLEVRYKDEKEQHRLAQAHSEHAAEQKMEAALLAARQELALAEQKEVRVSQEWKARYDDTLKASERKCEFLSEQYLSELEENRRYALSEAEERERNKLAQSEAALSIVEGQHQSLIDSLASTKAVLDAARQNHTTSLETVKEELEERHQTKLKAAVEEENERSKGELLRLETALETSQLKHDLTVEKHQTELKAAVEEENERSKGELLRLETALETSQLKHDLTVEKYTALLQAAQQKQERAEGRIRQDLEAKHVNALADVDLQYSGALSQQEAALEAASTEHQLAVERLSADLQASEQKQALLSERFSSELRASEQKHQIKLEENKRWARSEADQEYGRALSDCRSALENLESKYAVSAEEHSAALNAQENAAAQKQAATIEAAGHKYVLARQEQQQEIKDLKLQHQLALSNRDSALELAQKRSELAAQQYILELKAADEKHARDVERVKRVSIDEARQQILAYRMQSQASQQAKTALPAPPTVKALGSTVASVQKTILDAGQFEVVLEALTAERSRTWIWAQDLQRVAENAILGVVELHEAMLLLLEQAARHALLQGREDPLASGRIAAVALLAGKVEEVDSELQAVRSRRSKLWFALQQTFEEAVDLIKQAPLPKPAYTKRLDTELHELCIDQKRLAEDLRDLAKRLKAAGASLETLAEARRSLPQKASASPEAEALDAAGAGAQRLLRAATEIVSAVLGDVQELFYLVDGSPLVSAQGRYHVGLPSYELADELTADYSRNVHPLLTP